MYSICKHTLTRAGKVRALLTEGDRRHTDATKKPRKQGIQRLKTMIGYEWSALVHYAVAASLLLFYYLVAGRHCRRAGGRSDRGQAACGRKDETLLDRERLRAAEQDQARQGMPERVREGQRQVPNGLVPRQGGELAAGAALSCRQ
jgi:hypothetical protein